ncbi:hypothetical protein HPB48_022859 [Haemaphysalis longicornis]|uniref:Uncharacterized protein n=1 Tax=Haemaphysalis longicornis TaxID=44386 RepID=A0A9J6FRN3_HAELO|nr:hypothetical protein HPB48_022859 [Haemaphysalis longicornis]
MDKTMRIEIKNILHLPLSFPDILIHLPHRHGRLSVLQLSRVAQEVQLKGKARLRRLGCTAVDAVLDGPPTDDIGQRVEFLQVAHNLTEYGPIQGPRTFESTILGGADFAVWQPRPLRFSWGSLG